MCVSPQMLQSADPGGLRDPAPGGPALPRDCDLYSARGWSSGLLRPKEATQTLISGRVWNVATQGTNPDSTRWFEAGE